VTRPPRAALPPAGEPVLNVKVANAPLRPPAGRAEGALVCIDGERYYQITGVDQLPPFLATVASDADHFLFVSSTGALTAGRRHADLALFPYTTDDRLHDAAEVTGPKTILRVRSGEGVRLWEPFSTRHQGLYRVTRSLGKSVHGNKLRFEEVNHDLRLAFSYQWQTSARLGLVRRAELVNQGNQPAEVEVLDGVQNLLPPGIGKRLQQEMSTLGDAYKDSELDPALGLGIFRLSSIPVDAAEPSEALRATTIWSTGLRSRTFLLSSTQLDRFRSGFDVESETRNKGRRGAFFVRATLVLEPGDSHRFYLVADVDQDGAAVVATARRLRAGAGNTVAQIEEDVALGTSRLVDLVAGADGLEISGDPLGNVRHFANVLFNGMRGGFPERAYLIRRADLLRFVATASRRTHARCLRFLAALPEETAHPDLLARARAEGDPDLERLISEYLPLTFSRRHGDPSRPWNEFAIAVRDDKGQAVLDYQGNWRDLFQNWEALALAYPGYLTSMITKFVDASTADGHNPYRITRDGFEWEVEDPHDPWSYIGYWGDHQVIYLLRLLERSERYHPGRLGESLGRRIFSYANVPYRIRPFEAQIADPQETVDFAAQEHQAALARAVDLGSDGKLLLDDDGTPQRATLAEKLLLLALARLSSYVPEAGLWMNTQRPEWNDANNALVGNGASMVTLYHLRRYLRFTRDLLAQGPASLEVAAEIEQLFRKIAGALSRHERLLSGPIGPDQRRQVLESLARPMSEYRARIYAHRFSGERSTVTVADLRAFCDSALRHIDHAIRANRRDDGLYHAYNLIKHQGDGIEIRRLPEMLEGQVAVLSAGILSAAGALSVLAALRASALWRADQKSYLLYPDRQLPLFLEKNQVPLDSVRQSELLAQMLERKDGRLVRLDVDGGVHFNPDFRNAKLLGAALDALTATGDGPLAALVAAERQQILELYEQVFDHQSFTGRSGSFYKYEGLGSIYWHQVSKLLLAVQENLEPEARRGADPAVLERLYAHYHEIREGIGVHKPPTVYGAFPTDPYSHTPAHMGAQQPGLTGQVKEDIICRQRELGVVIEGGRLRFDFALLRREELLAEGGCFRYRDAHGQERSLDLPPASLAFTVCQVPVIYRRAPRGRLHVTFADGRQSQSDDLALDSATSKSIFDRRGQVSALVVDLPDLPD
jgi:hypothetical protein